MITESFDAHNPLGVLDYLGLLIWVSGLLIETTADIQKYIFNSKHESGANKQWIATGLWKYSRHPNYFVSLPADVAPCAPPPADVAPCAPRPT